MKNSEVKEGRLPVFKKRFNEIRGNMSNTEFATFLELSRQTVGFYLNGDRIPDALSLRQIAEKCEVSVDYLLGLTEIKTTETDIKSICETTGLAEGTVLFLKKLRNHDKPRYSFFFAQLIDELVCNERDVLQIDSDVLRATMATSITLELDEPVSYTSRAIETALDGLDSNKRHIPGMIRIPAKDAASLYINRAVAKISLIAQRAIEQTIEKINPDVKKMEPTERKMYEEHPIDEADTWKLGEVRDGEQNGEHSED